MGIDLKEDIAKKPILRSKSARAHNLCMPTEEEIKKELEEHSKESHSSEEQLDINPVLNRFIS